MSLAPYETLNSTEPGTDRLGASLGSSIDRIAAWLARSRSLSGQWNTLYLRSSEAVEIFRRSRSEPVSRGRIELASMQLADRGKIRSPALKGAMRRGTAARLRLGEDLVLTRTLSLPLAAEKVIGGILANQLEIILPWRGEDIRFGYRIRSRDQANGQLHVEIAATSSEILDAALADLDRQGIAPRIIDFGRGANDRNPIILDVRDQPLRASLRAVLKVAMVCFLAAVLVSALAGGWQLYGAAQHQMDLDRKIAAAQSAVSELRAQAARADGPAASRALLWKQRGERLPLTIAMEALSRAVPDGAWLQQVDIAGSELTIIGMAEDVTELVPALEASPQFSAAAFGSPSTRAENADTASFVVTARIEARGELEP